MQLMLKEDVRSLAWKACRSLVLLKSKLLTTVFSRMHTVTDDILSSRTPLTAFASDLLRLFLKMGVKDVDAQSGEEEKEFEGLEPDVLVSLTAPKAGAKEFRGRHFLGGRFVSK